MGLLTFGQGSDGKRTENHHCHFFLTNLLAFFLDKNCQTRHINHFFTNRFNSGE